MPCFSGSNNLVEVRGEWDKPYGIYNIKAKVPLNVARVIISKNKNFNRAKLMIFFLHILDIDNLGFDSFPLLFFNAYRTRKFQINIDSYSETSIYCKSHILFKNYIIAFAHRYQQFLDWFVFRYWDVSLIWKRVLYKILFVNFLIKK